MKIGAKHKRIISALALFVVSFSCIILGYWFLETYSCSISGEYGRYLCLGDGSWNSAFLFSLFLDVLLLILVLIAFVKLRLLYRTLDHVSKQVDKDQDIQDIPNTDKLIDKEFLVNVLDLVSLVSRKQKEDLSHFSHELRTPLAIILNNLEFLGAIEVDDRLDKMMDKIKRSAYRMVELTNYILSENLSNNTNLVTQKFSIDGLIRDILKDHAKAESRKIRITTDLRSESIVQNKTACWIILNNMITNALKHTAFGWVHIKSEGKVVTIENGEDGQEDNLDNSFNHSFGLGNRICKKTAEKINATIVQDMFGDRWVARVALRDAE